MKSGKAIIKTLEPINIAEYKKEDIEDLVHETFNKMKSAYEEIKSSLH